MSAAKIKRHIADTVNYPLRFNQSRARIKFECIIKQLTWFADLPQLLLYFESIAQFQKIVKQRSLYAPTNNDTIYK